MALTPGTRLGVYEVVASIGAGGMGQVFRARDTKLDRDVAIKILPEAFAHDADRLARFQREAKTLASLNHPNIAAIHGLEESGGVTALVMELVEGDDLSQRIAQGPIPLDEALPIAKQIAEALEAAHEQGIIHRDLKPANIKVRPDGTVKVLDFGLAKAMEPAGVMSSGLSMSPTITTPAMTQTGMILGTAAYMSPEQARGKPVDRRADIWAFGCVLYEMLVGRRAFDGEDTLDVLSAVTRLEPDWGALPSDVPLAIRTLLESCLVKDPRKRVADVSVALFVLDKAAHLTLPREVLSGQDSSRPLWPRLLAFSAAGLVVGGVIAAAGVWVAMRSAPPRVTRTTIATEGPATLNVGFFDRDLAITPDGTRVVYVGEKGGQLFVRSLDTLEPAALASTKVDTGAVQGIFTSPDGRWAGYVENLSVLKKVAFSGGPPMTLLTLDGPSRGAVWTPDDAIVFATSNAATGLQRVPAGGGSAIVLTRPDRSGGELDHLWPEILPDRRGVLFTITDAGGGSRVALLDLATGKWTTLVRSGSHAHYLASGHLLYVSGRSLSVVTFDLARLAVGEAPVPLSLQLEARRAADFDVADDGTLVYVTGRNVTNRALTWVDRQGQEAPVAVEPAQYLHPRISPDGTRVAVTGAGPNLWIVDLMRSTRQIFTPERGGGNSPIWVQNDRLVFNSNRGDSSNLYMQQAGSSGGAERLTKSSNVQWANAVTPDGGAVLFTENDPATNWDLWLLPLSPPSSPVSGNRGPTKQREPRLLIGTPSVERNGTVSHDGRWLAWESNVSGQFEIYVTSFPDVSDDRRLVSIGGGVQPLWAQGGRELFYLALDGALMSVPVASRGSDLGVGKPARLLERGYYTPGLTGDVGRHYDVSSDGARFLMLKDVGELMPEPPRIVVVRDWLEELKRLMPTK